MRIFFFCVMLALALPAASQPAAQPYGERSEVQAFIADLVQRHGFTESELQQLFSKVQRTDPVLQFMTPAERPTWQDYRAMFVNEARIAAGLAFWKANRRALARAEREYGVPAQFIVAIIGVETYYGRNMGRWRVIDALSTLAFDYPSRAPFFRGELEQYLLLAREGGLDVFALRGSYAGAIGIPQFMPGSLRRYGVDFDGDGAIDLRRSSVDAVGSVANFLKEHGWRAGEPVIYRARVTNDAARKYVDGSVTPKYPVGELIAGGLELHPAPASTEALGVLVALGEDHRVGLQNFWVITRYNRSAFYATVVSDLAAALAERRAQSAGK
ncbi:MAG TPA: lytic murein transglycosylase B [Burkholderiales bacterium]|nr:lytic murein transglycosylase B [Burkholderiales bacterium]